MYIKFEIFFPYQFGIESILKELTIRKGNDEMETGFKIGTYSLHDEPNINYQLNRIVNLDGGDLSEVKKIAANIKTLADWKSELMNSARSEENKGNIERAMAYYRMAEFYMSSTDPDKKRAYNNFLTIFEKLHAEEFNSGEIVLRDVPYKEKHLTVMHLPTKIKGCKKNPIVISLGFDAYAEEIYGLSNFFRNAGYEVYVMEGPGQGRTLHHNYIPMEYNWEEPVAAVLDHLELIDITLIGLSMGGYLSLRAAAFEKRISRVIAYNIFYDVFEVNISRRGKFLEYMVKILIPLGASPIINLVAKLKMSKDTYVKWGLEQGMFVTGTTTPYGYLKTIRKFTMKGVSHLLNQDVLLTAGMEDHFVPVDMFYRQIAEVVNARSITGRVFTRHESAENHCQVGNLKLVLDYMLAWINEHE